jgi:glycosyltransferase involved in cell wall biosynthesis
MMLTPLALFAYKRPDHTKATLEALARNALATQTHLFVFSDGPKGKVDAGAVASVRKLVREASGFASVTLVERRENMGLARSVITGASELLEQHQSIIVMEDDLVTSQYFLTYMNDVLVHYRDDPFAFSVTGHTFPAKYLHIPRGYPYDTYAGYRCSSWSWGTWRDRWQRVEWDMHYFPSFCTNLAAQEEFNRGGPEMTTLLRMQHEGKIDSWALPFCYAHYANGMQCIYPTKTLVRNIGLDNSGTHSKPEPRYTHASLDQSWLPKKFCPAHQIEPRIAKSFHSVFAPARPSKIKLLVREARNLVRSIIHQARIFRAKCAIFRRAQDVDILIVNTFQQNGGAARAAYRTFLGIKRVFPNAHYLNLVKEDLRGDISGYHRWSVKALLATRLASLDALPLAWYPNRLKATFTPAVWANPMRVPFTHFNAKLVHLHWVAASMLRIEELARLNVPLVWTLHDTWAFTGGCHYPGNCEAFRRQCGNCPHLASTVENDLSRSIWRRKQAVFSRLDLTVVAPSRWMADAAKQSSLFANRRVEVIPYGLDTDVFKPIDTATAKVYFGVNPAHPVLLFGAQTLTDPRKGGDLLCEAIAQIDFPCTLLTFGEGVLPSATTEFVTVRGLGSLADDVSLAMMYSAADAFLCPSREDNLPNTVAEALACGTPCVAFHVTGLTDMIEHRTTGWLAKAFDPSDFAAGIKWVVTHPDPEPIRHAAREKALADYTMETMTERYARLFAELLEPHPP